jgi:type IV secretory pathway VirB2 component (pilin)
MSRALSKIKYFLPTIVLALPLLAQAYTQLPPGHAVTFTEIDDLVNFLLEFIIGISFTLMVAFVVISGIMIMTSGGDATRYKDGLLRLKHAAIGAAVVMGAGVIIGTIYGLVNRSFFCQLSVYGICLY